MPSYPVSLASMQGPFHVLRPFCVFQPRHKEQQGEARQLSVVSLLDLLQEFLGAGATLQVTAGTTPQEGRPRGRLPRILGLMC